MYRKAVQGIGVATLLLATSQSSGQALIYVDIDATGANDGSTWSDAYSDLQDAINYASGGTGDFDIWIAEGVYIRSGGGARDGFIISAARNREFRLFGGFAGTEASFDDRAGLFSQTILSGNRGNLAIATDNAYSVLNSYGAGSSPNIIYVPGPDLTLDGMVIEAGYADGLDINGENAGGGVRSIGSLILDNCVIQNNFADRAGGGVYVNGGSGLAGLKVSMRVFRTTIVDNESDTNGGGLYADTQNEVYIHSSRIHSNSAENLGGGIYSSNRWLFEVMNSEISSNSSEFLGGGVYLFQKFEQRSLPCATCPDDPINPIDDDPNTPEDETLQNIPNLPVQSVFFATTFADNSASDGSAVFIDRMYILGNPFGLPRATGFLGCNIYENVQPSSVDAISGPTPPKLVSYTNYEGGWSGAGVNNVDLDPYFINSTTHNYRLRPGSPLAIIGDPDLLDEDLADLDIDGNTSELVFIDRPDLDADLITDLEAIPLDLYGFAREIGAELDYGAYEVCRADSNLNGSVEPTDFTAWVAAFNSSDLTVADVNGDGMISPTDLTAWIDAFNQGCN